MEKVIVNPIKVKVRIIDLKPISFEVLDKLPSDIPGGKLNHDKVQFELSANINTFKEKQVFNVNLVVNIFAEPQKTNKLGTITSLGIIEVQNFEEISNKFEGKMPLSLLGNLTGIVISATRGFLILKTTDTILEGLIIPLVDPNILFQKKAKEEKTK